MDSFEKKIKIAQDICYILNKYKATVSEFYCVYGWVKTLIEEKYVNDIIINMKLPTKYNNPF